MRTPGVLLRCGWALLPACTAQASCRRPLQHTTGKSVCLLYLLGPLGPGVDYFVQHPASIPDMLEVENRLQEAVVASSWLKSGPIGCAVSALLWCALL